MIGAGWTTLIENPTELNGIECIIVNFLIIRILMIIRKV